MSKTTEATSNSSNAAAASTNGAKTHTHGHSNGHTTAHNLDNKDAMLTHKRRGDAPLRDDEREELMMTDRNKNDSDSSSKDSAAGVTSGSLSGADTWNFALLVVLCRFSPLPKPLQLMLDSHLSAPVFFLFLDALLRKWLSWHLRSLA